MNLIRVTRMMSAILKIVLYRGMAGMLGRYLYASKIVDSPGSRFGAEKILVVTQCFVSHMFLSKLCQSMKRNRLCYKFSQIAVKIGVVCHDRHVSSRPHCPSDSCSTFCVRDL